MAFGLPLSPGADELNAGAEESMCPLPCRARPDTTILMQIANIRCSRDVGFGG